MKNKIKFLGVILMLFQTLSCSAFASSEKIAGIDLPKFFFYYNARNELVTINSIDAAYWTTDINNKFSHRIEIEEGSHLFRAACLFEDELWVFDYNKQLIKIDMITSKQTIDIWNYDEVDGCAIGTSGNSLLIWSDSSYYLYRNGKANIKGEIAGENILRGELDDNNRIYLTTDQRNLYSIDDTLTPNLLASLDEEAYFIKKADNHLWVTTANTVYQFSLNNYILETSLDIPDSDNPAYLLEVGLINGKYILVFSNGIYKISNDKLISMGLVNFVASNALFVDDIIYFTNSKGIFSINTNQLFTNSP